MKCFDSTMAIPQSIRASSGGLTNRPYQPTGCITAHARISQDSSDLQPHNFPANDDPVQHGSFESTPSSTLPITSATSLHNVSYGITWARAETEQPTFFVCSIIAEAAYDDDVCLVRVQETPISNATVFCCLVHSAPGV